MRSAIVTRLIIKLYYQLLQVKKFNLRISVATFSSCVSEHKCFKRDKLKGALLHKNTICAEILSLIRDKTLL